MSADRAPNDLTQRTKRLARFCDAYELDDRSELLLTLRRRLYFVGEFIDRAAAAGDPGMQHLVAQNTPKIMYEDDVRWLDDNWTKLERAL